MTKWRLTFRNFWTIRKLRFNEARIWKQITNINNKQPTRVRADREQRGYENRKSIYAERRRYRTKTAVRTVNPRKYGITGRAKGTGNLNLAPAALSYQDGSSNYGRPKTTASVPH